LAILANVLLLIALLTLNAPPGERSGPKPGPFVLTLEPPASPAPAVQPSEKAAEAPPVKAPRVPPPTPVKPPVLPTTNPIPFLEMTKEEFAAADISRFGNRGPAGTQQASAAGDSERVGTAPDGEPLYAAQWHRRPTRAELSAYLPPRMSGDGWGLIACKTVAGYRVEDCVELGDSPPGSRLAGAVRQAAWQFRVRPPRVGGKELVGTWVRIRIDYTSAAGP
jgi:protein TonB